MDQQNFLASEYAPTRPEDAAFHIIPAPLERSVSYGGGAAQGPAALLDASRQLEAWESGLAPGESGFYTAPPVDCAGPVEGVLARIESATRRALDCKAVPVLLGGEHTVSLGALRALARQARERTNLSASSSLTRMRTCGLNMRAIPFPTPASCTGPWPTWACRWCSSRCAT